jgi:ubiquinone/menaquinone biosynthesis C-methylase UbiE
MDLRYLDETQNASFDAEYHTPVEMQAKLARLDQITQGKPFDILDVGGGNGVFLDKILDRFPTAHGTLFDISPQLIGLNQPHPRKTLQMGNVELLDSQFPPQSFDVITLNWLLHHLVGSSYAACSENCHAALAKCRTLLRPDGVLVIAENMFDGFGPNNLPSRIIYMVTSIRAGWFVKISRKHFNTAGVGVCFRSTGEWRRLFQEADLATVYDDLGMVKNDLSLLRRAQFAMLALRQVSYRHFYLRAPEQGS